MEDRKRERDQKQPLREDKRESDYYKKHKDADVTRVSDTDKPPPRRRDDEQA